MCIFERDLHSQERQKQGKRNMSKLKNFSVATGFLIEIMQTFYFLMNSITKIVDQCPLTFILKHQSIF